MLTLFAALVLSTSSPDLVSATLDNGELTRHGPADARLHQAGSISKFACSVAALRLDAAGDLSLDASLGEQLPVFGEAPVTMRTLLQNRSGVSDSLMAHVRSDPSIGGEPLSGYEATLRILPEGQVPAVSEPGFDYHVTHWLYVQAVLELASGSDIHTVLTSQVLEPAGMTDAIIFSGRLGEGAAQPAQPARPMPTFLACAGGLAATPGDLLALARYPYTSEDFTEAMRKDLMTVATLEEAYALGGRVRVADQHGQARRLIWLTGSNGPYKSVVVYDPVSESGFAAMSAEGDFTPLSEARDRWLAEQGLVLADS